MRSRLRSRACEAWEKIVRIKASRFLCSGRCVSLSCGRENDARMGFFRPSMKRVLLFVALQINVF